MKNFYLTTPLYYVNDAPHIGHAYTTILADVINRYHKILGYDTFLMTGTDEHGQKVQQAATKRGVSPQEHVDTYNVRFKDLWVTLGIEYDKFIRTTDTHHKEYVQKSLLQLWEKGEIYSKDYSGWYSVSEERFFNEDELVDGKDPIGGKAVDWIEEKNYFFKMSSYQEALIAHIEANPHFIVPDFRKNEVLGFLRQPLQDLCISRPKSRLSWGIPLPFDEDYVTYVWFDALLNYVSGVEGMQSQVGESRWPAAYHLIGKDILTTHSVYWTTMLMALELPLPQHILAHGWWLNGGAKMSKSSGTAINPMPYIEKFGVDSFRYYVMRDMALGQDASFTDESYFQRLNSDLSNDLGNGLNRVIKMVHTHCESKLPHSAFWENEDEELKQATLSGVQTSLELMEALKINQGIEEIMSLVRKVNKYLEVRAPWKLIKNQEHRPIFETTMATAAEVFRIVFHLLEPVMPQKSKEGLLNLGCQFEGHAGLDWSIRSGAELPKDGEALFPRIEFEKKAPAPKANQIVDPIDQLDLRVVQILKVEEHPEAEALWVLQIDDGMGGRQVCAGLRKYHSKEELLNRKAVLLANLKPAKLRGFESAGMLLAGGDETQLCAVSVPDALKVGTQLSFGNRQPQPKSKLKITDFEKVHLETKGNKVVFGEEALGAHGISVQCPVKDGMQVK